MPNPTIIVFDDFFTTPDRIRSAALQQEYVRESSYFKTARTKIPHPSPWCKEEFEGLLRLKIPNFAKYQSNGVFNLAIGGDQVVYHSDEQQWAGCIYLTPNAPPESGTCLYRSKENKLRKPNGPKDVPIMYGDKGTNLLDPTKWELVDHIGNIYNRLVLWQGQLVHAGVNYFGHNLQTGRLSQLFFFDAE
jgi:hypothetical protein